jgi:ankyrin repeat protein
MLDCYPNVEQLIKEGANVNERDDEGRAPIHYATTLDIAELLLDAGSSLSTRDAHGAAPLHIAASMGYYRLCEFYIEHGADIHVKDSFGASALHEAAILTAGEPAMHDSDYEKTITILLQNGVPVDSRSNSGNTPLFYAHCPDVLQLLIAKGANANAVNDFGLSVLHHAILTERSEDVVEALLRHGATPNSVYENGDTPLIDAVRQGNVDVVELLLDHGADLAARDRNGQTALDIASDLGLDSIARVLQQHEEKTTTSPTDE